MVREKQDRVARQGTFRYALAVQSAAETLAIGSVIAGKYRIEGLLGEGAMGRVLAATHLDLERRVALKFMLPQRGVEEELLARFMREARAVGKLKSEHIVEIYDVGRLEDGSPYLVMELLDGEDAGSLLARRGTLDPFEATEIVAQACAGVAEAHREGIVHRDIKPQNLFLSTSAGKRLVKVLDFGISKIMPPPGAAASDAKLTKVPLGTPLYMSPEQLRSSGTVDPRADVWALGATLYELLTGDAAFMAPSLGEIYLMIAQDNPPSPRTRRATVPFALDAIVMRCLEKNPDARYSNAAALQRSLVLFLSSNSTTQSYAIPTAGPAAILRVPESLGDSGVSAESATQLSPRPLDSSPLLVSQPPSSTIAQDAAHGTLGTATAAIAPTPKATGGSRTVALLGALGAMAVLTLGVFAFQRFGASAAASGTSYRSEQEKVTARITPDGSSSAPKGDSVVTPGSSFADAPTATAITTASARAAMAPSPSHRPGDTAKAPLVSVSATPLPPVALPVSTLSPTSTPPKPVDPADDPPPIRLHN